MIKKRLLELVPESKKYIAFNVLFQWIGLFSNIIMVYIIVSLLSGLLLNSMVNYLYSILIILFTLVIRVLCIKLAHNASYHASKSVKSTLRGLVYQKLLKLGASYNEYIPTAEVVQLAGEGVEQLETYFGQYMPQLFYAFLAPITLFLVIRVISLKVAVVLLICVPLIPVAIVLVQKIAKRLLKDYWEEYSKLGDHFLENLQGLTTLKIYQADEARHEQMRRDAEYFRRITMKVLSMQLNSIIVMDTIAYGGAALGIILSTMEYLHGNISFQGCFMIILLSADFFLPMRQLGSYFHVAMNGMSASDRIFALLDIEEKQIQYVTPASSNIAIKNLAFSYIQEKEVLHSVNMEIPEGAFIGIVGKSGCGKSTIAGLLTGRNKGYSGNIELGGVEIACISQDELMKQITLISHNSYLFKGTLKENLLMGKIDATNQELWNVLEKVKLADFIRQEGGLSMSILEGGSNLSGGQRQRLALARAILHNTSIYIFDEATSNIDIESEKDIMEMIYSLKAIGKSVILITHSLMNVVNSDYIYVMDSGNIVQSGSHQELLKENHLYLNLWNEQHALENMLRGGK